MADNIEKLAEFFKNAVAGASALNPEAIIKDVKRQAKNVIDLPIDVTTPELIKLLTANCEGLVAHEESHGHKRNTPIDLLEVCIELREEAEKQNVIHVTRSPAPKA